MIKVKHSLLIFLAGALWLIIGIFLMTLGIRFLLNQFHALLPPSHFSLLQFLQLFVSSKQQALGTVLTLALFIGYLKGRFALTRSVERQVKRISELPEPASLAYLYSKGYYFLIGGMILLGMLIRFLPIALDTRGAIDVAIGFALINGAAQYFRLAFTRKTLA